MLYQHCRDMRGSGTPSRIRRDVVREVAHFSLWLDELVQRGEALPPGTFRDWTDGAHFSGWSAAVDQFLIELLGPESVYYLDFDGASPATSADVPPAIKSACLQILYSLRDDLRKGRLVSLRALVTADMFSDFLEMAEHLLQNEYKDPGASLIGAVFEIGLREIAVANGLKVRTREDLTSLNNRLAEKNVYSRLAQKSVAVWIDIRNHADHGQFGEYTLENVKAMLTGVQDFLSRYQ
jgi:hypothetical protein